MKWRKKFITCSLLAGLTVLIASIGKKAPSLRLLASQTINFPSASGIEYHQNKLYIFGDNATHVLILSTDYKQSDSVSYWKEDVSVIEKKDKPDIESAMIAERDNEALLYGIGSMSDKKRWIVYEFSLNGRKLKKTNFFEEGQIFKGIEEVNIEGSTVIENTVVLCNRANNKTKRNHLLFWNWKDSVAIKEITLPDTKMITGISGLHYMKSKDILLFTASQEDTDNATKDGAIGDSFLGWINGFSKKMSLTTFAPDGFIKLSTVDKAFKKQKIESVCIENVSGNSFLLNLVSDNDKRKSKIFKVQLTL